jgi:alpha-tubulin suppressor-like RCC1 family protein
MVTVGASGAQLPLNPAILAAGGAHTCALTTAGGVRCWGDDADGQLGDYRGAILYSTTPANAIGLATNVASIASGFGHSCALRASGGVLCWGASGQGQLGDGTFTSGYSAVNVLGLESGVARISASPSGRHTCALTTTGTVKCWGSNAYGQLGTGSTVDSPNALDVAGLGGGNLAVAAGGGHSCVLTSGRGVKCWGRNTEGELGNGTTANSPSPVDVIGLAGPALAISAAFSHTCALLVGGTVECWGWNGEGELGAGSSASFNATPLSVQDVANATAIAAGGNHTCALAGGELRCWGRNAEGQNGNGTTARHHAAPVEPVGL